ncbi:MAG: hypothetical protein ACRDZ4_08575 [Egibacteraceae bacterium]
MDDRMRFGRRQKPQRAADPGRVEFDAEKIVVRPPCCPCKVSFPSTQVSLRQPRRLTCWGCARAWRLDFFTDAEAGWTAAWTLLWDEPALRPRRGRRR